MGSAVNSLNFECSNRSTLSTQLKALPLIRFSDFGFNLLPEFNSITRLRILTFEQDKPLQDVSQEELVRLKQIFKSIYPEGSAEEKDTLTCNQYKCKLEEWMNEAPQEKDRIQALERILKAYEYGMSFLDLSDLDLSSLPEAIHELKFLEIFFQNMEINPNWEEKLICNESMKAIVAIRPFPHEHYDRDGIDSSQLQEALKDWVTASEVGEQRNVAAERIKEAWLKQKWGLDLKGLGLKKIPFEIGMLMTLSEIDLSNNRLSMLPVEFSKLKKLNKVFLKNNQFDVFPEELFQLYHLNWIDLRNNQLRIIPDKIQSLKRLNILCLENNQLRKLPKVLGELPDLEYIGTTQNPLDQSIVDEILEKCQIAQQQRDEEEKKDYFDCFLGKNDKAQFNILIKNRLIQNEYAF